jgi:hypothetical protein
MTNPTKTIPEVPLHHYLGITQERFDGRITPFMNNLMAKGMKADLAMLKIESSDMHLIEKVYCAYLIGRVVGIDEVNKRTMGLAKRLGVT